MVDFNPYVSSAALQSLEGSKPALITRPYGQGLQNLGKAFRFNPGDIFKNGPEAYYVPKGLKARAAHLIAGVLLLIPIINTVVIIALRQLCTREECLISYDKNKEIRTAFVRYFEKHPHEDNYDLLPKNFEVNRTALYNALLIFGRELPNVDAFECFLTDTKATPQLIASLLPNFTSAYEISSTDFSSLLQLVTVVEKEEKKHASLKKDSIAVIRDFLGNHPEITEMYKETCRNITVLLKSIHVFYNEKGKDSPVNEPEHMARFFRHTLFNREVGPTSEGQIKRIALLKFIFSHQEQIFPLEQSLNGFVTVAL